jgi:hypothetical protein
MSIQHHFKMTFMTIMAIIATSLSNLIDQSIEKCDADDILQGNGLFIGSTLSAFHLDSDHTIDFISWEGGNVLK